MIEEGETTLVVSVTDLTTGAQVPVADDATFPVVDGHHYVLVIRARDAAGHLSEIMTASHIGW